MAEAKQTLGIIIRGEVKGIKQASQQISALGRQIVDLGKKINILARSSSRINELTKNIQRTTSSIEGLRRRLNLLARTNRRVVRRMQTLERSFISLENRMNKFVSSSKNLKIFANNINNVNRKLNNMSNVTERAVRSNNKLKDSQNKTTNKLREFIREQEKMELSFGRLFRIVFLYVLAFEALHKVITLTTGAIETMISYNKQMEDLTLGIATVLTMIGEIRVGGEVLQGVEKFNTALKISANLMEDIREKSLQAFVPMETVAQVFQAIVGFGLQAGASLKDIVDLSIKFAMAVQALQLPMNQVVQEARDLLQGGIQPASSTLAVILGINDSLVKKWKEQGILIDELKKRLKDLESVMSAKFETLSGKIFALSYTLRRAFGEGGSAFFLTVKLILDDIIQQLFNVEEIVDRLGNKFYKITPKKETVNTIKKMGDYLADAVIKVYAFVKALIIWSRENKEFVNSAIWLLTTWIKIKVLWFVIKNILIKLYKTASFTAGVFVLMTNIMLKAGKRIRDNWDKLFKFLNRRPFILLAVFVGLSGAIIGVFRWMVDKLKTIFSDFFEGWLTNKLKAWRDKIQQSGIVGKDKLVGILDWLIGSVSEPPPKQKTFLDYIIEGYEDSIGKIGNLINMLENKAKKLINITFPQFKAFGDFGKMWEDIEKEIREKLQITKGKDEDVDAIVEYKNQVKDLDEEINNLKKDLVEVPELMLKFASGNIYIEEQIALWEDYRQALQSWLETGQYTEDQLIIIIREIVNANDKIRQLNQDLIRRDTSFFIKQTRARVTDVQIQERRGQITPFESLRQQITLYSQLRDKLIQMQSTVKSGSTEWILLEQRIAEVNEKLAEAEQNMIKFTGTFSEGFVQGMKNQVWEVISMYNLGAQFAQQLLQGLYSFYSQLIDGILMKKIRKFKDVLEILRNVMARVVTSILAQLLTIMTIRAVAGAMGYPLPVFTLAKGGIVKGGLQTFQTGGVVTEPTLALIGEGRDNEAVVPLPDGRHIPVMFTNAQGQQGEQEINIINVLDESLIEQYLTSRKGRKIIRNVVGKGG